MIFTSYTDGTTPMSYHWDFGDDTQSTAVHPTHIYQTPGSFTVTLTATNAEGSHSTQQRVEVVQTLSMTSDPFVVRTMDQVSTTILHNYVGDLSGAWPILVDGEPYTLTTRYSYAQQPISIATNYAYEHFTGLGLPTSYHTYTLSGHTLRNVIAEQVGHLDPERIFLLTAHIDSIASPLTLAPGADDNASGTAGVLMAADILSQYRLPYTLRYVLFTGEEQGVWGSAAYATDIADRGEHVAGVLNLDMIAYNSTLYPEPVIELHTRSGNDGYADQTIARLFADVVAGYHLDLIPEIVPSNLQASDHASFWQHDYPAILAIEDFDDFNPYYHSTDDTLDTLNWAYYTESVKATIGTLLHLIGQVDFTYTPETPIVLQPITFAGMAMWASDPLTYTWDFGDGTIRYGRVVTHAFPFRGNTFSYPVSLTVTTENERIATQHWVPVSGAELNFSYDPSRPYAGDTVTFTGTISPSISPLTYTWNFGDGTGIHAGNPIIHTLGSSTLMQDYTVTLTATHPTGTASITKGIYLELWYTWLPLIMRK
jgi:PKD repeat protein